MTPSLPAPVDTLMHQEAAQASAIIADQYARNADTVKALAADLRRTPPPFVVTCARGSSDHAATYAKYLFETQLGVVTASASPSVGSVYESPLQLRGALYIVISQSGKSPDLLRNAEAARAGFPPAAYPTDGAPHFERIHTSPGDFNSAIFYRGNILHSGVIDNAAPLVADPRAGRLTINAFFRPAAG